MSTNAIRYAKEQFYESGSQRAYVREAHRHSMLVGVEKDGKALIRRIVGPASNDHDTKTINAKEIETTV